MTQVLMNLGTNAVNAMPEGGTITIETENIFIDEEYIKTHKWAEEKGKYALIVVEDTGTGIPEDDIDKVFEPFFTTKEKGKGTGMGLSMVYGIVKQLGGQINIYSEIDKGTVVKIYLPILERKASEVDNVPKGEVSGGDETILVVEDEQMVRETSLKILGAMGYEVMSAKNGREALDILKEKHHDIDLVLLDVVMPEIGGKEVWNNIQKKWSDLKVIFCSGYTSDTVHTGFVLKEGMTLIRKPYNSDELLRTVRKELDKT